MSTIPAWTRSQLALAVPLGLTLFLTLARAWRWPNDFAEAHWLLDYRFGFVKRGLAGHLLHGVLKQFGARPTARIIAGISVAVLVLLSLVLLWTALQVITTAARDEAAVLASLAFVSSPFVVMTAHLMGYLDGIVLLLAVGAVALTLKGRLWAAAATQAIAILVHESAVFVGLPLVLLAIWVTTEQAPSRQGRAKRLMPLSLPFIACVALALSAGRLRPDFQQVYSLHLMNYPFVAGDMHIFVPEWITPGFLQHIAEQKRHFVERITEAPMLGLVLPTVIALLAWTMDACRLRARSITAWLFVGATFAPQLMHLAAWDTMRIWTYSIAMAWLGAWILTRVAGADGEVSLGVRGIAVLALLVNVAASAFLLDHQTDHYSLATRLVLFAPTLITALVLFLRSDHDGSHGDAEARSR